MVFSDNEELGNNGPVAEISAKCAGDGVINVNFDGGESYDPDGSVVSYSWSFGDGALGNGEIASHSFPSFGIYKVTLTIADDHGAIGSATIALEINSAGICYYRVVSSPSLIF
jgi:PKD repeat protein